MDWSQFIIEDSKKHAIIVVEDVANRFALSPRSVHVALRRQERKGFVERLSDHAYLNKLSRFDQKELLNVVRPDAYISLESALSEWGVSKQVPSKLTCVSKSFGRDLNTPSVHIVLHKIKKDLSDWGVVKKKGRYFTYTIAEPEKAFLDWVYFQRQNALPVETGEFDFTRLNTPRLLDYSKKYPRRVQDNVNKALLESLATSTAT